MKKQQQVRHVLHFVSNVITEVSKTCQFSVIQLHTVSVIMDFDISHEQKNCFVESVHKKAQL